MHRRVSFSVHERPPEEGCRPKWTQEQEARLRKSEQELHRAQKKWSDTQEMWIEEVETLRELKKESQKFYQRRQKHLRKEGVRFKQEVERSRQSSAENSDAEDDSVQLRKSLSLPQRIMTSPALSTNTTETQPSSRKSSIVGRLVSGKHFRRKTS